MRKRVTSWAIPIAALWPGVAFAHVPLGPELQVNTHTTNGQWLSSVASDASGNFVVVWESVGRHLTPTVRQQ